MSEWYYKVKNKTNGPVSLDQLKQVLSKLDNLDDFKVKTEQLTKWHCPLELHKFARREFCLNSHFIDELLEVKSYTLELSLQTARPLPEENKYLKLDPESRVSLLKLEVESKLNNASNKKSLRRSVGGRIKTLLETLSR